MLNDKELLKIVNQIQNSDRIYAVRDIGPEGLVLGGTGCTVTMGLLRTIEEVYVFTPNTGVWWQWAGSNVKDPTERYWVSIHKPKKPHGSYTGIGSHKLDSSGIQAIKDLYGK